MNTIAKLLNWQTLTLPRQFLLAGAVVMTVAMIIVGTWVSARIESAVVQNSAATTALLMESFISPLSQELSDTDTLSPPARQALAEVFNGTTLGERVVSYKIWMPDGLVVHASDPSLIGQSFEPSYEQSAAWAGRVSSSFEDLDSLENEAEAAMGVPLLEVYSPIRQIWSGEIIAVAEFYEVAGQLSEDIKSARRTSWMVVGGAFLVSGLLLFGIVQAGGRTIGLQRAELTEQLAKTKAVSEQNARLRQRVVAASARAVAQTEQAIRRIGSDLHDGPAQYLSLASLRLDGALNDPVATGRDKNLVRESLDKALDELRIISRGLALPDLDILDLEALVDRAVQDHSRQTGLAIAVDFAGPATAEINYAQKLCVFRFLQEALSNASHHGKVESVEVGVEVNPHDLTVKVADTGSGFDTAKPRRLRQDGGQGLFGLKDRAESLGGTFLVRSGLGIGTELTLILPFEEAEQW